MALQSKDFSVTGKSSGGGITYTFILRVTENSVSIPDNTSNITVQAILKQSYSGLAFTNWNTGVSCTLNGSQIFSDYKKRQLDGKQEHIYYTWTGDISHNADGSLLLKVGGKLWQSSSASYTPPTMSIAESSENAIVLTVIPRASTVRAADANVGSCATVVVNRKSTTFTHSIGYCFGALSGYLDSHGNPVKTEVKMTESILNFLLPESFYAQIPNAPSGVCTLTCRTYSGNTRIGEDQTGEFTVTAGYESSKPLVSGSVRDVNPVTVALTGNEGVLVQYASLARCQIAAQPRNGASVTHKWIGGVTVTGNVRDIADPAFDTVTFEAIDSRGYTAAYKAPVTLLPYVVLTNNAAVRRTAPTSGNAVLTLQGNCWNGNFGAAKNTLTATVQVNKEAAQTLAVTVGQDHRYQVQVQLSGLDYTRTHTVTVTVKDKVMSVTRSLSVQKGTPVFDWGEEDFRFHVPVDVTALSVDGVSLKDYIQSIIAGGSI